MEVNSTAEQTCPAALEQEFHVSSTTEPAPPAAKAPAEDELKRDISTDPDNFAIDDEELARNFSNDTGISKPMSVRSDGSRASSGRNDSRTLSKETIEALGMQVKSRTHLRGINEPPERRSRRSSGGDPSLGRPSCRMITRYAFMRVKEQLISVGMIGGYLVIFFVIMLHKSPEASVYLGLASVVVGITFFMEGFMMGIMPLAEVVGKSLPTKFSLLGAMVVTFFLGIACTLAEPAMGALELAGSLVEVNNTPILWYMLNDWNLAVFFAVGLGVGFAALVGTLRLLRHWNLKLLIYTAATATVGLTMVCEQVGLGEIVGMAWDTGAVTTGAVTVPIILGLGVGIMKTDMEKRGVQEAANPLDSFGIVTLASLYPVICVLLLGLICKAVVTEEQIFESAYAGRSASAAEDEQEASFMETSPWREIIYATRAVVPLIALVVGLIKFFIKESLPHVSLNIKDVKFSAPGDEDSGKVTEGVIRVPAVAGVLEAYIGMILFNLGLRYGLGPLGDQVGAAVPGLYSEVAGVPGSPLITPKMAGISVVIVFTFFMALVATYAEPALNAMGLTTEQLTHGAFRKVVLMFSVGIGVATGVVFGLLRIVQLWPLPYMLLAGYIIACLLTTQSSIEYVSVAWDAAGVTTGSITVPLVLAMGLGLGYELGVNDGFGLLATGSVGPIISVLVAGLTVRLLNHRKKPAETGETAPEQMGVLPEPTVVPYVITI